MSKMFNLNKKSSIPGSMFARHYQNENHVETSINLMTEMNTILTGRLKSLYTQISESEDVKDENSVMRNFITGVQNDLDNIQNQISGHYDRFAISVSNSCSMARDQAEDTDCNNIKPYTDTYTKFRTDKLMSSDFPRMNPYSIFEKEFIFIAQLMQELPATASHKDRLEIVSTVYNNFNKIISGDLTARIYNDMFGDSGAKESSLVTYMFSVLKESTEDNYTITEQELMEAKACIANGSDYISSISTMTEKLTLDLKNIINDLNAIITGSQNNKFKVDTKEDGIRNTTYSVDLYTSNKILWLVREKIEQLIAVYNKYILAITIKMEAITSYIDQSCDIISSMCYMHKCNKSNDEEHEENDDEPEDNEEPEDDEPEDHEENDDEPEDPANDNALDGGDDILTPQDETDNDTEDEPVPDFEVKDDEELEEAYIQFQSAIFEYSCMQDHFSIIEHVSSILLEEETPAEDKTDAEKTTVSKTKELVDKVGEAKSNIWKKVISSIVNLWNKFKETVVQRYQEKVDFLKANEKYIAMPPIKAEIKMPVINIDNLDKIKIPDFNYGSMKANLDSEAAFMNSQPELKPFAVTGKDESISQKIKDSVIDPVKKETQADAMKPKEMYNNYCSKFISILDEIKKMTAIIEKGEKNADSLVKQIQSESTKLDIDALYFQESEFKVLKDEKKEGEEAEGKGSSDIQNHLKVYFSTCGKIMAAKMSVCQKVFDEYNAYLVWHIGKKKGSAPAKGEKSEASSEPEGTASKFD